MAPVSFFSVEDQAMRCVSPDRWVLKPDWGSLLVLVPGDSVWFSQDCNPDSDFSPAPPALYPGAVSAGWCETQIRLCEDAPYRKRILGLVLAFLLFPRTPGATLRTGLGSQF